MSDKMDEKLFAQKFRLAMRDVSRSLSGLYHLAKQSGLKPDIHSIINHYGNVTKSYVGYRVGVIENIPSFVKELNNSGKKNLTKLESKRQESIRYFNAEVSNKIGKYVQYNVEASNDHSKCGVTTNKFGNIEKIVIHTMHDHHARYIGSLSTNKVIVYAIPHKHDRFKCWRSCYLTFKYDNGIRKVRIEDCFIMKDQSSGLSYYHTDYKMCADGLRRTIGRSISKRIGGA